MCLDSCHNGESVFDCQFLQRQKVLGIYRDMLRTIRQVPEEADRKYLRDWARHEFRRNKSATDQVATGYVHTARHRRLGSSGLN